MKIYMSGFAADKAGYEMFENNKKMITERFPSFFLEQIEAMNTGELNLAKKTACLYACKINETGLYGALWDACEKLECGCDIYFENIPVKQETIELMELFAEDPYEMSSFGELILLDDKDDPETIFRDENNIFFIGITTDKKDRVVINRGNKRFLTPPSRQQKDIDERKRSKLPKINEKTKP